MLTSTRYGISYPNPATRADTADVPRDIAAVVTNGIERSMMYGQGSLASRPVSTAGTPGIQGRMYVATDQTPMQVFYDYGTGWTLVGADPTAPVVPIGGSIEWDYAAAGIPTWSLLQYGQAVSRTTYVTLAALAAAASYPHGTGDGSTTFNLADKRGRVSAGKDDMGGTAASRITAAISGTAGTVLGAAVGNEGVTLATGQMPSHNHSVTGSPTLTGNVGYNDPGHHHPHYWRQSGVTSNQDFMGGNPADVAQGTIVDYAPAATTGITVNNGTLGVGVGSLGTATAGSGTAHLNTQPTIIVNKIIRAL